MIILFDTNVILDHLLDRSPYSHQATQLFTKLELGELQGYLCATTVTTIHYFVQKAAGHNKPSTILKNLLSLFEIAPVTRTVLENALSLNFKDFEDAVLHEAGIQCGAEGIVTRNLKDFEQAKLTIYSPTHLCNLLAA